MNDYSPSFNYVIANHVLYKYSSTSNTYSTYLTLSIQSSNYKLYSYLTKIVLIGYNATPTSATFSVTQNIYIIKEGTNGLGSIVSTLSVSSVSSATNYVPIYLSPEFTKLHYEFM